MLIGFIGCPCSGKTTTAAQLFSYLKSLGLAAEFIPEQARTYIAEKRLAWGQAPGSAVDLIDEDQAQILLNQIRSEDVMTRSSGPGTMVITDTATLCTLAYMSPELRQVFRERVQAQLKTYDLLFYCAPVKMPVGLDSNRVHSQDQALLIDMEISQLLQEYGLKPQYLLGDDQQRHQEVKRAVLERIANDSP